MKKVMLLTVGACLLAGMAVPVSAQSGRVMLKGEIPFAFVSGDRTIQAGQYSIEIGQLWVKIFDANGHPVQSVLPIPRQENGNEQRPRLVFHKYGDTYFLHQIWTMDYKVDFRISRAEYQLKASLKADEGTVILAMR